MKVVVVGAGIAGLGAATYFSRRGHDVSVLEANDYVGGRAVTFERSKSKDLIDVGTQYYHSNYQRALHLINDVGLNRSLSKIRGYTRIYGERSSEGSFLLNHRTPWYSSAGITGNLQLGHYLLTNLLKFPMAPFSDKEQAAADNRDGLLQSNNLLIREAIVRPLSLTGALSEPESMNVSLLHVLRLIRVILLTDYLSLDSGTASLHKLLADRLKIRLGTRISHLLIEGDKVIGLELDGRGEVVEADHVVLAIPPPSAMQVVPFEWTAEKDYLKSIIIPSFSLPTFFLDRPMQKNVWSYLLKESTSKKISFVTDASQKNPAMVPSGNAVIQPWICFPDSEYLLGLTDADIIKLCEVELEEVFPGFCSSIEKVHITHHPYAVPFTSIGHQARSVKFLRQTKKRGVSFCGDYLSGGYMESALWSAELAAANFA
jgi:protoporphyrinogen/coproporphyrinogen III oxidase